VIPRGGVGAVRSDGDARLDALRGQKGVETWQQSKVQVDQHAHHSGVVGFRAGTNVSTLAGAPLGKEGAAQRLADGAGVDSNARTAYGRTLAQNPVEYTGPEVAAAQKAEAKLVFVVPPPLVGADLLLPRDSKRCGELLIAEVNKVRTDPAGYAAYLEHNFRQFYADFNVYAARRTSTEAGVPRATLEGVGAFDEVLATLKRSTPVPALILEPALHDAASASVAAHVSGNESKVDLAQFGNVEGRVFSLCATHALYADEALLYFLVCDGDATRRARRHLLDAVVSRGGAAASVDAAANATDSHSAADGTYCVVSLCQTFRPHVGECVVSYKGKVPIWDTKFLEVLLALPSPLPRDSIKRIKAGGEVTIDYKLTGAKVTIQMPDGAIEDISVSLA